MAEYELVREIQNLCRNNQMRDVFFEEVTCDNPEAYVRSMLHGREIEISTGNTTPDSVTIHAVCDGIMQKFVFTKI